MRMCISNPPYNLQWKHPAFVDFDSRFFVVPKESNANFAFIQIALGEAERATLILPNSVLCPNAKEDKQCLEFIVSQNWLEAVVLCPQNMFVSTDIGVCLMFLNKNKTTATTELIDMRNFCATEIRNQNGQFGGDSHKKRTYQKQFNIFAQGHIDYIIDCIENRRTEKNRCVSVGLEDIKSKSYDIRPTTYIETEFSSSNHRPYKEIVNDLNNIISKKNLLKLTINKTLARNLGLDVALFEQEIDYAELNKLLEMLDCEKIKKQEYITFTASSVLKFENMSKKEISPILMMIFAGYKQNLYSLNQDENKCLAELRDALLPELMGGKIKLT